MTSLNYNTIYSRLFSKIEAYDFIELPEADLNELLCDWIHSASANPYVRRLFTAFSLDIDTIYSKGQSVLIKIPQNDKSNDKIILCRTLQ